jgi:hypothetical protein
MLQEQARPAGRCLGEVFSTPLQQELMTALPRELRMARAVFRMLQ